MKVFAFTLAAAATAQTSDFNVTERAEEEVLPPTCQDGFVLNAESVCVEEFPCRNPHSCALEADCAVGDNVGDFTCTCRDGYYGDGTNFCKRPGTGCAPGATGEDCACTIVDQVNITAAWNDTDNCFYEVHVHAQEGKVGSWYVELDFDTDVAMDAVWTADSTPAVGETTNNMILRPKFWNLEQTGFVNFHVTSMNAGSCLLENAPAAQLCSSEYVEPEPEAPTVGLTCVPIDVTIQSEWIGNAEERKQSMSLVYELPLAVRDWQISLSFNDAALFDRLEVWDMQFDAESFTLSPMEYNKILYAGTRSHSAIVCSTADGLEISADICYTAYE